MTARALVAAPGLQMRNGSHPFLKEDYSSWLRINNALQRDALLGVKFYPSKILEHTIEPM